MKKYGLTALSLSIISALHGAQVHAQQEEKELEVIQVKGIRGALASAMDVKRSSSGVVDAISAEDIGKFPDTNLAESLQRITGVSIDRTNNEGNQVTVRGFGPSFNLVTLNNRQMPNSSALETAGISRSFNFRELAAESVSGVEVYKTGRANVSSGGIGATININTARPFAMDEFVAVWSAKAVMDTSVTTGDSVTPEVSGMISKTFEDRKFGILASYSHAERDSHVDRIGAFNWSRGYPGQADPDTSAIDTTRNPTLATWRTPTVDLDDTNYERERQNGQLVLQYRPTDSLTMTADYVMSRLEEFGNQHRMSFWFDNVEQGAADVNGTIINPLRTNDELNFWSWEYNFETENDSYGLNFDWQANDALRFKLDLHDSTSHSNPGALPAERLANLKNPFGAAAPVTISADFSGDIPSVAYDDSALPGGAYALENIEGDLYQERGFEVENNIQQVQFSGRWLNLSDGALDAIHFGIAHTKYTVDSVKINGANFGLGNGALDISELDLRFIEGDIGFEFIPVYSADQFIELTKAQGLYIEPNKSLNGIEEITTAAFLSFDFVTEFNDMEVRANFGVRYEESDVESYSINRPVVGFNWLTPLEMSKVFADEEVFETLDGSYEHFLPNFDFSLSITDDIIARFAYSKTIARSDITAMFPATSLDNHLATGPFRASQGNPNLLPYEADNFDLSLEYYYDEGSYVSLGHFRKQVDNFIAIGEEERVIEGPNGPLTNPAGAARPGCPGGAADNPLPACVSQPGDPVIEWIVSTPLNLDETRVYGWEFNVQHLFGESGFGTIVNYTMVDSSDNYDVYSLENDFALPGLSDSANLVAFYEQDNYQVRIAYNWRDEFLLQGGIEPLFTEEYSQIDISASYDINESLSLFLEGINVTNEKTRRHQRFSNQIRDYEEYGPRYNIGIRGKF
ncbi:TonB-dependent receptor [Alteromonas sp. KC3]|uniref:TonB-dependent receptor n=1 Tax=unclassified Alteromonas TaxID=2614992 RepID=UPI001920C3A4|nr:MULTISPECIES: TonB-dependent receptor [unclassified Alteromonas]BCO18805.1 TonB-dependent receptor [Alteromonas sp. KC3]BCO22768.1 TonB-dependent receptor [Alteromonas sp. KC14]